jgi:hypothetical protein
LISNGTKLSSGLEIQIAEQTHRYFGDYHRVRISITSSIQLEQVTGLTPQEQELASRHLPAIFSLCKTEEKMGVCSADLQKVRQDMLATFTQHAVPYLSAADFPARMVRSALKSHNRQKPTGR